MRSTADAMMPTSQITAVTDPCRRGSAARKASFRKEHLTATSRWILGLLHGGWKHHGSVEFRLARHRQVPGGCQRRYHGIGSDSRHLQKNAGGEIRVLELLLNRLPRDGLRMKNRQAFSKKEMNGPGRPLPRDELVPRQGDAASPAY